MEWINKKLRLIELNTAAPMYQSPKIHSVHESIIHIRIF